ncbi:hypothetical protein FVEG_16866 [Fusarium verticillioides 7600]|uniref:Uncharacterized protein n=1 Tax=Gibberella moniliformis (strain M3125 / FGSC 7600) TaxID=334819 RepID=W7MVU3_GIBM7|nr:hypothetical protein FVEG_16866 [Fusarium verticillioides 7600]EWG51820.1 hypothetical protein FVEG_16866 [Fusarium verticillioides 7600]
MPGRDRGISYDASPHTKEMPRVLCPKCTTTEKEVWVMPGHSCPYCGYVPFPWAGLACQSKRVAQRVMLRATVTQCPGLLLGICYQQRTTEVTELGLSLKVASK